MKTNFTQTFHLSLVTSLALSLILVGCGQGMQVANQSSLGSESEAVGDLGSGSGADQPVTFPEIELNKVSELAQSAEETLLEAEELLRSHLQDLSRLESTAGAVSTQSLPILGLSKKLARPLDQLADKYAKLRESTQDVSGKLDDALARLVGSDPLYLVLLARIHGAQEKIAQLEQRLTQIHLRVVELVASAESQVDQWAQRFARSRNVLENLLAVELYGLKNELTQIRQRLQVM